MGRPTPQLRRVNIHTTHLLESTHTNTNKHTTWPDLIILFLRSWRGRLIDRLLGFTTLQTHDATQWDSIPKSPPTRRVVERDLASPAHPTEAGDHMPIHNVVYGGSLAREMAGRSSASATARSSRLRGNGWGHVPRSSLSGCSPRVLADVYTVSPQPPPDAAAHHMWAGVGSPQPHYTDEEQPRHSPRRPATAKVRRKAPLRQLRWLRVGADLS
jgi:hypothetical protein